MRSLVYSLIVLGAVPQLVLGGDKFEDCFAYPASTVYADCCEVDCVAFASFLYWQVQQDNLAVGLVQDSDSVTSVPNSYLSNHFVELDPGFTPGFQVGLGVNFRNAWEGLATYTRVHGSHSVSSNGSDAEGISIYVTDRLQAIFPPEMGAAISSTSSTVEPAYTSLSSNYRSHLDFLDAEAARTYSIGDSFTLRTAIGLRAASILQSLVSSYEVTVDPATARQLNVISRTNSWGVGPRFGTLLNWGLGEGFSLFGSAYGDVLYTWYHIQDKTSVTFFNPEFAADRAGVDSNTFTTSDRPEALRPHIDLEIGAHWDTYFCNSYHLDFSLAYGFQVFFDQNMFRHWDGLLPAWNTTPHGNMYVNGLTFTVTADF